VDEINLISRFLRLEKQEKIDTYGCVTRQRPPTAGRIMIRAQALNALGPADAIQSANTLGRSDGKGLSAAIMTNSTSSN
jgi:hypothetical protein